MADFTPATPFEQWAAVEVENWGVLPEGMEALLLPGGPYAVFIYRGIPAHFSRLAQYIFGHWLPQSTFALDDRPHFEIMGEDYRPDDPNAEEEVWIPLKGK